MKIIISYILSISICIITLSCKAQSKLQTDFGEITVNNNDTTMVNKFMAIDFDKYKGKPIGVFLDDINKEYLKRFFYEGRPGYASFLRTQYSKSLVIDVHVEKYEYMNPIDKEYKWDIEKFRKEKLSKIKIRYNGKCIKGCNEEEVDR
jgi:hypothetical protein